MLAKEACFVDAPCIGVGPGSPEFRAYILALLIFLGLMSLAAVQSYRFEHRECGPFTIGRSAIGGCDWIGR
jgi:hypothetical protein